MDCALLDITTFTGSNINDDDIEKATSKEITRRIGSCLSQVKYKTNNRPIGRWTEQLWPMVLSSILYDTIIVTGQAPHFLFAQAGAWLTQAKGNIIYVDPRKKTTIHVTDVIRGKILCDEHNVSNILTYEALGKEEDICILYVATNPENTFDETNVQDIRQSLKRKFSMVGSVSYGTFNTLESLTINDELFALLFAKIHKLLSLTKAKTLVLSCGTMAMVSFLMAHEAGLTRYNFDKIIFAERYPNGEYEPVIIKY